MPFYHRKSPRALWMEYNEGVYFVTVCTLDKKHYFGTIQNDEMRLSAVGKILSVELNNVQTHYPYIEVLQSVVMPNHFHMLVNVVDALHKKDTARRVPTVDERIKKGIGCDRLPLLSTFVGGLKSAVTRQARQVNPEFAW